MLNEAKQKENVRRNESETDQKVRNESQKYAELQPNVANNRRKFESEHLSVGSQCKPQEGQSS